MIYIYCLLAYITGWVICNRISRWVFWKEDCRMRQEVARTVASELRDDVLNELRRTR